MPRPKRPRTIHSPPSVDGFKPSGTGHAGEVTLSFEEFEAIRLKDFENLSQEECAKKMRISQPTFHRLILVAKLRFKTIKRIL